MQNLLADVDGAVSEADGLMGASKHQGRNVSIRRVLSIARQLEGLRYAPSLQALAKEHDVNVRTIRRDLELLESLGIRVPMWRVNEQLAHIRGRRLDEVA